MLGKLLKYELKAMGRVMLPLYLVLIFVSCFFAVNMKLSMNGAARLILNRFAAISTILFVVAVMATVIVMALLVFLRFYKNLLGSEGYLMFTLPVTAADNILSKGISALIWIVIGIAAGIGSGFLMVWIVSDLSEYLDQMKTIWNTFIVDSGADIAVRVALLVAVLLIGIISSLCKVYAAIAVGHEFQNHRLLSSIIAYVAFGLVELAIASIPAVQRLVYNRLSTPSRSNLDLITMLVVSLIQVCVYGGITWYLLDRKLNLE